MEETIKLCGIFKITDDDSVGKCVASNLNIYRGINFNDNKIEIKNFVKKPFDIEVEFFVEIQNWGCCVFQVRDVRFLEPKDDSTLYGIKMIYTDLSRNISQEEKEIYRDKVLADYM